MHCSLCWESLQWAVGTDSDQSNQNGTLALYSTDSELAACCAALHLTPWMVNQPNIRWNFTWFTFGGSCTKEIIHTLLLPALSASDKSRLNQYYMCSFLENVEKLQFCSFIFAVSSCKSNLIWSNLSKFAASIFISYLSLVSLKEAASFGKPAWVSHGRGSVRFNQGAAADYWSMDWQQLPEGRHDVGLSSPSTSCMSEDFPWAACTCVHTQRCGLHTGTPSSFNRTGSGQTVVLEREGAT